MKSKKQITVVVGFVIFVLGCRGALAQDIAIIPQPREMRFTNGEFVLTPRSVAIQLGDPDQSADQFAADLLRETMATWLVRNEHFSEKSTQRRVVLGIPKRDPDVRQALAKTGVVCDSSLGEEGYVLVIRPTQIVIAANTGTGVFYGVQTLRQICRTAAPNGTIPCLTIRDWPTLPIRIIQDDISRGPIPTMDFFLEEIRRFAELKFNRVTYYIENVVRTQKHGEFSPPSALTLDDIRGLSDYAAKYHIELVGAFQSFGHFERILAYPQYENLGEQGTMLSPVKEESYQLLSDVYDELSPLFPSPFFNVLCDETWALGRGASEKLVKEEGIAAVYAGHIRRIRDLLTPLGKQALVAADVVLKYPEMFDLLPKDIILEPWDYSPHDSFDVMLRPIQQHGFDFLVLPGISGWRRIFPNLASSRDNLRVFIRDGIRYGALGVLNCTWDDYGGSFFTNQWYGVAYAADQSWHSENPATVDFDHRFAAAFYGDTTGNISRAVNKLSDLTRFPVLQGLENTVFWQRLIPDFDVPAQISLDQWSEIRADAQEALHLLENTGTTRFSSDLDYIRYAAEQFIFMADIRRDLLRAAQIYRDACLSQPDNERTLTSLQECYEIVKQLHHRWTEMGHGYEELWRRENREYWLNRNRRKFSWVLMDIADVMHQLDSAKNNLKRGYFLPPPSHVRLDIRELEGGFFQTWLICGSFPNPKKNKELASHEPGNCLGFDTDYLAAGGGEAQTHPQPGETVTLPDGGELTWQTHTTTIGAKIDLAGLLMPHDRTVAYAYCTIETADARTVTAAFGSNDGIKVYLNGEKLFETHQLRFVEVDDDTVSLNLQPGVNHLMLKIDQGRGKWGFAFRLLEPAVTNTGFAYKILEAKN